MNKYSIKCYLSNMQNIESIKKINIFLNFVSDFSVFIRYLSDKYLHSRLKSVKV